MADVRLLRRPGNESFVASRPLLFALNGHRVEIASPDPSMTLLSFLRSQTQLTGTKLSCGEGGCGACLVLLSTYDPKSKRVQEFSINSCLALLCSLDGCSITTIEGIGSSRTGFHAVQQRIAGFHGSHCGFCTPGMCISIYSSLRNTHESLSTANGTHSCAAHSSENGTHSHVDHQHPVHTIPTFSCEDAQKAIVGNICRCTGYRPIVDACKSFAEDVDIEDLGINTFWASNKKADASLLPAFVRTADTDFPKFLIEELNLKENRASMQDPNHPSANNLQTAILALPFDIKLKDSCVLEEERLWIQARSLEEVFEALQSHHGRGNVKLVVGNTSAGYYKGQNPRVFIDISHVPELLTLQEVSGTLRVGAAVTIEVLILALESRLKGSRYESVIGGLVSHLRKVANPHVRHRASVGGNLIMAQQFSFDSDLATLLLAVGSSLDLVDADRNRSMLSLAEFLEKGSLESGWLLECIHVPLWSKETDDAVCYTNGRRKEISLIGSQNDCFDDGGWRFDSYRAAPRSLGNSLAYINAAFLAKVLNTGSCYQIIDVKLAFGAFGRGHAIRAQEVEGFLRGRPVHESVLLDATTVLKTDLMPFVKGTKWADYKVSVAVSFLFDFFSSYLQFRSPSKLGLATALGCNSKELSTRSRNEKIDGGSFIGENIIQSKSSFSIIGRQNVPGYKDDISIGMAMEKSEAKLQASGEAVYVDDIPSPEQCLYAAFVSSAKAFAKVKMIDTKNAVASPGAVAFISASDIPKEGANVGALYDIFQPENLFATDCVEYVGHPLGVMVADSPEHAQEAAAKVRVEYEVESSPILCVEDAVAKNSLFTKFIAPLKYAVGDVEASFLEADHMVTDGEVSSGSQYFFYMETQTALAVPDEDNCLVVYSACQSPSIVQESISACLGIPHHNVRVITRRVGGAFGGKAFRNVVVASACAVAAHKLQHPVRMYLDRKTDMVMMGGRHPVKAWYSVSFKHDGKVTGLRAKISVDGGWSQDFTSLMPLAIYEGLKKYNWVSLDVEFLPCKTNLPSKSAMRAPGFVQGSFIADTILEHLSSTLGLDMKVVVSRNLHSIDSARLAHPDINIACKDDFDLLPIWNTMLERVKAKEREIDCFNISNHWLKRGLSVLPCVYKVHRSSVPARVSIFRDGSVVVEVGGIEIGQGLWTKVKQATANGLSPLCVNINKEDLESLKIRVVQADSMSLPHGGITASSTTSEASCEAVMRACQLLVERIMPVKLQKEKDGTGNMSWIDLITLSKASQVDLSAQVHWFPERGTFAYLTYSVAATVVEVNTLTGAVAILESDLVYDCGKSLNPAVDIGQIEGSFVQGIGFFLTEQYEVDENGVLLTNGTWTYKPPTVDNIPQKFFVELISGAARQNRVLSSKACGEPPLLLAGTVHLAVRRAIQAARKDCFTTLAEQGQGKKDGFFRLDAPASMERVKKLCGLERVEDYLKHPFSSSQTCQKSAVP